MEDLLTPRAHRIIRWTLALHLPAYRSRGSGATMQPNFPGAASTWRDYHCRAGMTVAK
ncbi:hypothetical protein THTE_4155 [Thermogutta terrifontis]|uniref:Uncharacterized protein n=1 Tax=Thermogutta terrifontis TaxID=1331910 RepID=A0A286RLC3_9BACT|nr:hypothetical protein THTE_4155 [Thermogutta terrifontis]